MYCLLIFENINTIQRIIARKKVGDPVGRRLNGKVEGQK